MRKLLFLLLPFYVLCFVGCGGSSDSNDLAIGVNPETTYDINPDMSNVPHGTISIKLPSLENSKTLTFQESQEETDTYEVVIYNGENAVTAYDFSVNDTINVPIGIFKVVVLAGKCRSNSTSVTLLGIGMTENVEVLDGERTDVVVNLKPKISEFVVPAEVTCGRQYTVTITGNTIIDVIDVGDASIRVGDAYEYASFSQEGQEWVASAIFTAPGLPTSALAELNMEKMYIVDHQYEARVSLFSDTHYMWHWQSRSVSLQNPDSSIYSEAIKPITFLAENTGVGVEVNWEE